MIGRLASLPGLSVATEGFPPSVAIAAPRLGSTGVHLGVTSQMRQALPVAAGTFELVIGRHPIEIWWREIARLLRPGGTYFAQHVGPHGLRSLREFLMGPLPDASVRDTEVERRAAEAAGLVVQSMRLEHPCTAFFDIGAVVYFLCVVPWIVPTSPGRSIETRYANSTRPWSVTERSRRAPAERSSKRRSQADLPPNAGPRGLCAIVRHEEGSGGRTRSCQQGAHSAMRVSAATPRPNPVR